MRGNSNKNRGFTLIQTMVALTATAALVGIAALAFYRSGGIRALESTRMDVEEQHRITLDRIKADLAQAIRTTGATATTMPGVSRSQGVQRTSGELLDGLLIRTPFFGQFTLTANYAGGRSFTIDRTTDNGSNFDLYVQALTQNSPRKITTVMLSNMNNTNIVLLESASVSNASGTARMTITWAVNGNPSSLSNDYSTNSSVTMALTQSILWNVNSNGELVRTVTRGAEVTNSVEAENVERFLVQYYFSTDRGLGLTVQVPQAVVSDGSSAIPNCTPAPPSLCPDYRDVFKMQVEIQRRHQKTFNVASWNPGDTRFSLDSSNRLLFFARETVHPYLQNLLLVGGGGVGTSISCPLNSYASRCRADCKSAFRGTTPWAQDWWQFGDPDSNYCKCAVRVTQGNQEIFYAPETTAGQYFIRNNATYGFGCDPGTDWCLGYNDFRDRWHAIKNAPQGARMQACMRTFNICRGSTQTADAPNPPAGGFMMVPISWFACGWCTYTGGPYYGPDPDIAGGYRFFDMLDNGTGGLRVDAGTNGSYLWDYISDPANANNLRCGTWCGPEITQFSFTSDRAQYWGNDPIAGICRCRLREQFPRTPTADDPSTIGYGSDLFVSNIEAFCDIDRSRGLPWSDPGATSPRPASLAACPNAWDTVNDRPRLRSPDNPQGMTEIMARTCECARQHHTQGDTLYDDFRESTGGLYPIVSSSPYSGYPGAAWLGGSPTWMNYPTFAAPSSPDSTAKSIPNFDATVGTNTVQIPGGRCDQITCDFRWAARACCTAPSIVAEAAARNIPMNVSIGATQDDRNKYAGYCHDRCLHQYDWERLSARRLITGTRYLQNPQTGVMEWEDLPLSCGGGRVTSPGNPLTGGL